MKLYIRFLNGAPYLHPVPEEHLLQIHPEIDVNNLPDDWRPFCRVERPSDEAEFFIVVADKPTYVLEGNVVKDYWATRDMTFEEKQAAINKELAFVTSRLNDLIQVATNALQLANDVEKVLLESYLSDLNNTSLDNPFTVQFPKIDKSLFKLFGIPEPQ